MGVRILYDSNEDRACLYDSVTDWAFGPVFFGEDVYVADHVAEQFLTWLKGQDGRDARTIPEPELESLYADFLTTFKAMRGGD